MLAAEMCRWTGTIWRSASAPSGSLEHPVAPDGCPSYGRAASRQAAALILPTSDSHASRQKKRW
jgi:hypothetical protein